MPSSSVAALILAAGSSTRFNGVKAGAPWGKMTLLGQAIATAQKICGGNLLVVTGAHAAALKPYLKNVTALYNPDWQDGMGRSTAAGVEALLKENPRLQQLILMTVDQPLTTPAHLQALLTATQTSDKVALTSDGIHRGPPACVPARFFEKARSLSGERGLKSLLVSSEIVTVEHKNAARDCDTPANLQVLANLARSL